MINKLIKSLVFLFLITILSSSLVLAKNDIHNFGNKSLVLAPPLVTTPIYLCQNSVATPLTATATGGGTLTWYAVSLGGTALPGAPTPITTTVGSTTYYVTETIAGIESTPRTPIVVNVVADNGTAIPNFRCDPTQILAAIGILPFFLIGEILEEGIQMLIMFHTQFKVVQL